ncbi:MAG: hypothetical protein JWO42_35 [Chloroflexi bacterium]|nr:hypothetical protein [Chloroflexota bacterium]
MSATRVDAGISGVRHGKWTSGMQSHSGFDGFELRLWALD